MYENQSMSTQASRTLDHKETFHGLPTGNTLPGFSVTLPDHDDELGGSFAVSSATEQFSPAHSFWKPLETHSDLQPARDCEKDSNLGDISNLWHSYFETGDHLPTLGSFLHSKHPPTIDHFHPNFSQTHCSASSTAPNSLKVIPSESIIDDNVVCTYRPPTNITSYGSAVEPSHFVVRKNSFESSETCNESEDIPFTTIRPS
ncbi:hypothetical protein JCM33374_g6628 [Metschnikowia sp. JCM 33374]|nr:hypothetical protein JCM33374_g6628 [Metschnikowia sp. JCM 33374]